MHTHNTKTADQIAKTLIAKTNETEMEWIRLEATDPDYKRIESAQQNRSSEKFYLAKDDTGETFVCTGPDGLAFYRIKNGEFCLQPTSKKMRRHLFTIAEQNFETWVDRQILVTRRKQLAVIATVRDLFNTTDHTRLAEDVANELTYRKMLCNKVMTDKDGQRYKRKAYRAAKKLILSITESPVTENHGWLTLVEREPAPVGWSAEVSDPTTLGNLETDLHTLLCPCYDECLDEYREWATFYAAKIILLSILNG